MGFTFPGIRNKIFSRQETMIILDWLEDYNVPISGVDVYLKDGNNLHYTYDSYASKTGVVVNETDDLYRTRTFKESGEFVQNYSTLNPNISYDQAGIKLNSRIEDVEPLFQIVIPLNAFGNYQ